MNLLHLGEELPIAVFNAQQLLLCQLDRLLLINLNFTRFERHHQTGVRGDFIETQTVFLALNLVFLLVKDVVAAAFYLSKHIIWVYY